VSKQSKTGRIAGNNQKQVHRAARKRTRLEWKQDQEIAHRNYQMAFEDEICLAA